MTGTETLSADGMLKELGGCGWFQVILIFLSSVVHITDVFSHSVMSFGIYNPGWKCMDDVGNNTLGNGTQQNTSNSNDEWMKENCDLFETCNNVVFNPEARTIVTEWALICNRNYIRSTLLSVSHFGGLGATLLVGYIGDRFGRKTPLLISRVLISLSNIASIFTPTWVLHTILLTFIGFIDSFATLQGVLVAEYVPSDWRVKVHALPTWSFFHTVFALTAMYAHDWTILRWIAGITGLAFLVAFLWIPKSLRWLSVNGKGEEAYNVAKRIAKLNKAEIPTKERIDMMVKKKADSGKKITTNTTVLHLFKKGYTVTTLVLSFISFSLSVQYFVLSFGVAVLPGNIYVNMLIMNAVSLPSNVLTFALGNRFPRRYTVFTLLLLNSLCFFAVVAVTYTTTGDVKRWTVLGFILLARLLISNAWMFAATIKTEVYPTVARGTASSFSSLVMSVGGIVSPLLIPSGESNFGMSYLIIAIAMIICAGLILLLPETRNVPLKESWYEVNVDAKIPENVANSQKEKSEDKNGVV